MAILGAMNIIRAISTFHITAAYYLLTDPTKIANHNFVLIMGAAMKVPLATSFDVPTSPTALLAAVLAFVGITDLTAAALPDEVSSYYWSSQGPIRLVFFFLLTAWTYAMKPQRGGAVVEDVNGDGVVGIAGSGLSNHVVFTWAFMEMMTWFWVFITLRDERREAVAKGFQKRKAEEDAQM